MTTSLPLRPMSRFAIVLAAAIALVSHMSASIAEAYPHFRTWDTNRFGYSSTIEIPTTVVSAIAAGGDSETGKANGVAAFQFLESGREGRHLRIEVDILAANDSFSPSSQGT